MTRPRLHDALRLLLNVSARHRYYPLVVGLIALLGLAYDAVDVADDAPP